MPSNWFKQAKDRPLFPDILWSRPENRRLAGKLFIVGGNLHKFTAVSEVYSAANEASVGALRVLLPDALAKTLGKVLPEASYAASTPSGGLARNALAEFIDGSAWADATLLAGDFGRSSETAILIENFIEKGSGPLVLAGDSIDFFAGNFSKLQERGNILIAAELASLQKLLVSQFFIKQTGDLNQLVESLNKITTAANIHMLTAHQGSVVVSSSGRTSTTKLKFELYKQVAAAAVFWLQNQDKAFESITTSILYGAAGRT